VEKEGKDDWRCPIVSNEIYEELPCKVPVNVAVTGVKSPSPTWQLLYIVTTVRLRGVDNNTNTGDAYTVQRRVGDVRAWWRWMTETIYISNRLFECRGVAPTQAARRGHLLAETMTSINITEARDVINCWRQESVTSRQSLQWRSGEQWSSRFVIWLLSVSAVHYSTACVFIIPVATSTLRQRNNVKV